MSIWSAIGAAAGYAFGGPAGAAIGASVGGGIDANNANAVSAQAAQDFSAQQYATRYQTTVKDLEAAGLSPMLAYSQGAGTPPTGVTYQSQNIAAGVPSAYASTANLDVQREQGFASAAQSRSQAIVLDETVSKIKQEVSNLSTQQEQVKAVIDNLHETRQNLVKEGWNLTEQGNLLRASVSKIRAEIPNINLDYLSKELNNQLTRFDVEAAQSSGNLGRRAGEFKDFVNILLNAIKGVRK